MTFLSQDLGISECYSRLFIFPIADLLHFYRTAKVWEIAPNRKDHKLVYTLRNREHPEPKDPKKGPLHSVWAVLALGGNQYLTGTVQMNR